MYINNKAYSKPLIQIWSWPSCCGWATCLLNGRDAKLNQLNDDSFSWKQNNKCETFHKLKKRIPITYIWDLILPHLLERSFPFGILQPPISKTVLTASLQLVGLLQVTLIPMYVRRCVFTLHQKFPVTGLCSESRCMWTFQGLFAAKSS